MLFLFYAWLAPLIKGIIGTAGGAAAAGGGAAALGTGAATTAGGAAAGGGMLGALKGGAGIGQLTQMMGQGQQLGTAASTISGMTQSKKDAGGNQPAPQIPQIPQMNMGGGQAGSGMLEKYSPSTKMIGGVKKVFNQIIGSNISSAIAEATNPNPFDPTPYKDGGFSGGSLAKLLLQGYQPQGTGYEKDTINSMKDTPSKVKLITNIDPSMDANRYDDFAKKIVSKKRKTK